jgi:hypothetical protein
MARALSLACLALLAAGCGGESGPEPRPQSTPRAESPRARAADEGAGAEGAEAAEGDAEPAPEAAASDGPGEPGEPEEPEEPEEPDFDAPFPDAPCPAEVRVRVAHRSAPDLPPVLDRAVAFRSEDGRHLRLAIANHDLARDARGRFAEPADGQARFEADAVRRRRGPLEPRTLGPPDSRRGGLTHVRIVTPGPRLTFGHRDIGRVELTEVSPARVCGRIDLDDGFARVRGAFTAPVVGPLPP